MAAKLLVLAAIIAAANAGLLSLGYGGGSNGQNGGQGGNLGGQGLNNYYNNAPLGLNHGPLPQAQIVAPLRYAPGPSLPLATTTTSRQQISRSYPAQVTSTTYGTYGYNGVSQGINLGQLPYGGGNLGGNNAGISGGQGGYGRY